MAHLQYSEKDKGFYVSTRRDLNLGWTHLDEKGEVVGITPSRDITSYERVLLYYKSLSSKKSVKPKKKIQRRMNIKKGRKKK